MVLVPGLTEVAVRFQVKAPSTLSLCWKEARPLLSLKCEQDPSCLVIGGRRFVSFGWRYGTSHSHLSLMLIEGKLSYHRFTGLVQKKLFEVFHATSPQFLKFRVKGPLCKIFRTLMFLTSYAFPEIPDEGGSMVEAVSFRSRYAP